MKKHGDREKFSCFICGREYLDKPSLIHHLYSHTGTVLLLLLLLLLFPPPPPPPPLFVGESIWINQVLYITYIPIQVHHKSQQVFLKYIVHLYVYAQKGISN